MKHRPHPTTTFSSVLIALVLITGLTGCEIPFNITSKSVNGYTKVYFGSYQIRYFGDYYFTEDFDKLYPPYDRTVFPKVVLTGNINGLGTTRVDPHFSTAIATHPDAWERETAIRQYLEQVGAIVMEIASIKNNNFIVQYKMKSERYNTNVYIRELVVTGPETHRLLIWSYNQQNLAGEADKIFNTLEKVFILKNNE